MIGSTSGRGFAGMDPKKQHEIAQMGGEASSQKQDMAALGRKGAAAQSTKDKAKGGRNSHKNS